MANDRDCENCKHHKEVCKDGIFYHSCESWDCEFEPCEPVRNPDQLDCVNRQAVLDTEYQTIDINGVEYVMLSEVQMKMRKLPSVSSSEKTGHWVFDEVLDRHYYCSECKSMGVDYWDYCPNCGAKMVEGSGEE